MKNNLEVEHLESVFRIYIDIEFNGMPNQEIINIGCFATHEKISYYAEKEQLKLLGKPMNVYVKPKVPVTSLVEELTGINNKMLDEYGFEKDKAILVLFNYIGSLKTLLKDDTKLQFATWGKDDMKMLKRWIGEKWQLFEQAYSSVFYKEDINRYYNLQAKFGKILREIGYPEIENHGQRSLIDAAELLAVPSLNFIFYLYNNFIEDGNYFGVEEGTKHINTCIKVNHQGNYLYHEAFQDALVSAAIGELLITKQNMIISDIMNRNPFFNINPKVGPTVFEFQENMKNLTSLQFTKKKQKKKMKITKEFLEHYFQEYCHKEHRPDMQIYLDKPTIRLIKDGLPDFAKNIEFITHKKLIKNASEDIRINMQLFINELMTNDTPLIIYLDDVEKKEEIRTDLNQYGELKVFRKVLKAIQENPKNKDVDIFIETV